MNNIWMDAEAYMGYGTKFEDEEQNVPIYNTTEVHLGPENKRECPCDTCPLYEECQVQELECSAMRNWCSKGNYEDKDVQRLKRGIAIG